MVVGKGGFVATSAESPRLLPPSLFLFLFLFLCLGLSLLVAWSFFFFL